MKFPTQIIFYTRSNVNTNARNVDIICHDLSLLHPFLQRNKKARLGKESESHVAQS